MHKESAGISSFLTLAVDGVSTLICFITLFHTFGITVCVHTQCHVYSKYVWCQVAQLIHSSDHITKLYPFSPPTHIDSVHPRPSVYHTFLSLSHTVPPPGVTITNVTSSQVVYETTAHGSATRVIAGYEVFRFGVPLIGEYVNTGRWRRVTISPVVPGAQYRITAWALGNGSRSATPAVESVTTGEASEFCIRSSAS